ncbi:hypothetical protein JKP88DRAFT_346636 [Tribonema minus]|uniref:Uncharacterized protein n=1 Tax=Tribonema minus TaxID=303371 RepID=A0A835YTA3_9STRA|nr:hypothetical protein JKP88DRAFT_346636 [Tribonema minus]
MIIKRDIYIAESDEFGLTRNAKGDWTRHLMKFTAKETAQLDGYTTPYIAALLVPAGAQFNPKIPGGWRILDREYMLQLQICGVAVGDGGDDSGSGSDGGSSSDGGSGSDGNSGSGSGGGVTSDDGSGSGSGSDGGSSSGSATGSDGGGRF